MQGVNILDIKTLVLSNQYPFLGFAAFRFFDIASLRTPLSDIP